MAINPALADLQPLVGRWRMELYNAAFLPDRDTRVAGSLEVDWLDGRIRAPDAPGGCGTASGAVWIIGRDDSEPGYSVLYADNRGVSRIYRMSFEDGRWRMSRNTPEFSQRFEAQLLLDGGNDSRALGEVRRPRGELGARLQRRLHPRDQRRDREVAASGAIGLMQRPGARFSVSQRAVGLG